MWKWLEKVIGTYDKPLVLTKEVKRARTRRGRYKGDDKSTDDYNEAWEGGKAPKKRRVYRIKGKKYTLKKTLKKRMRKKK
jgi:hypothetical protein|tara:strand:- start:727 stop:966 length:240 start_codon:yes stop_codon:yes gene_type:complete